MLNDADKAQIGILKFTRMQKLCVCCSEFSGEGPQIPCFICVPRSFKTQVCTSLKRSILHNQTIFSAEIHFMDNILVIYLKPIENK